MALPPPNSAPLSVVAALAAQRQLGPRALFEGLLSSAWSPLQETHYRTLPGDRRSGARWASLLIEQLWLMGFVLWEHRKSIMHSPDSIHSKEELEEANTRIHEEYGRGSDDLPATAQHLFKTPLRKRLKHDLPEKERWLDLVQLERHHNHTRNRQRRLQRRRFEAHFDRPTRPPGR